jgi:hypothetical protein
VFGRNDFPAMHLKIPNSVFFPTIWDWQTAPAGRIIMYESLANNIA